METMKFSIIMVR